jgi:hypothetical protein
LNGNKKWLLKKINVILAFFSVLGGFAQNYTPLLGQLNEWHFTTCNFGCITDVYYTDGDTVVNGKNYKILDGYHYINRNVLLREDFAQQKVFVTITSPQFIEDLLLYDFSLKEGDSIQMRNPLTPFPLNGGYFILDSIRLHPLANGNESRNFYFSPTPSNTISNWNAQWIEGIGSLSMINAPGGSPDINQVGHLSCAFKNADLIYSKLDSIKACEPFYLGLSEVINPLKQIQLYSQSEKNHFLLTNTGDVNLVSVFGLTGKLIKTVNSNNEREIKLDLSDLSPGVYILKINQYNKKYRTFKTIVK